MSCPQANRRMEENSGAWRNDTMFCKNCGNPLESSSMSCTNCGAKVTTGTPEPSVSAGIPPVASAETPAPPFEEMDADKIPETDIIFECPHCGKSLSIDQRGAGLVIACTQCHKVVTVPIPDGMAPAAAPEETPAMAVPSPNNAATPKKKTKIWMAMAVAIPAAVILLLVGIYNLPRVRNARMKALSTRIASRGKNIATGIFQENMQREANNDGAIWPGDSYTIYDADGNLVKTVRVGSYATSSEYFDDLIENGVVPSLTSYGPFSGDGIPLPKDGKTLSSDEDYNIWSCLCVEGGTVSGDAPFLFTRNLKLTDDDLRRVLRPDRPVTSAESWVAMLDPSEKPFGRHGIVIVTRGGAIRELRAKDITPASFFGDAEFGKPSAVRILPAHVSRQSARETTVPDVPDRPQSESSSGPEDSARPRSRSIFGPEDPVKAAKRLVKMLIQDNGKVDFDAFAEMMPVSEEMPLNTPAQKQVTWRAVRNTLGLDAVMDMSDLTFATLGPKDPPFKELPTDIRDKVNEGSMAFVLVSFDDFLGETHSLPLAFRLDENSSWRLYLGENQKEEDTGVTPKQGPFEEGAKWGWEKRCAKKWGDAFTDTQKAFEAFGGFRLMQPPVEEIAFETIPFKGDVQRNVPLRANYRRFTSADLAFSHGALVGITLKVRFPTNISKAAIDRELETLEADFTKRMEALRINASLTGAEVRYSSSSLYISTPADKRRDKWSIEIRYSKEEDKTGCELSMSMSIGYELKEFMENVMEKAEYEAGDDLPELEEDTHRPEEKPIAAPLKSVRGPVDDALPPLDDSMAEPKRQPAANRETLPGLEPMVAALKAVRDKPTAENVSAMEKAWGMLPEEQKALLQKSVVGASCATLLARGDKESAAKRLARLDKDAFWQSVSDGCQSCGGVGHSERVCTVCGGNGLCRHCRGRGRIGHLKAICPQCNGSRRCTACQNGKRHLTCDACSGTGRIVSKHKCGMVFKQNIEDALRFCCGEQ